MIIAQLSRSYRAVIAQLSRSYRADIVGYLFVVSHVIIVELSCVCRRMSVRGLSFEYRAVIAQLSWDACSCGHD